MSGKFVPGETVKLSTKRFIVRSLTEADISPTYVEWLNDSEVNTFLEVRFSPQSADRVRDYLNSHDNRTSFLFGIFADSGSKHIGNFSLVINPDHKIGALGVMVGDKEYWGAQVVLETRTAILDLCFGPMDLAKVHGGCYSDNRPAIYNYRRQGWQLDGIRRNHVISKGRYVDVTHFAMFKENWLNRND